MTGMMTSGELDALLAALRRLMRATDDYRHEVIAGFDLGHAEYLTITELLLRSPLRAIDIQARTGLAQGSVTALLDRLELRGIVARDRSPENKRTLAITLTPAGRELGDRIREPLLRMFSDLVDEGGLGDPIRLATDITHIADAVTRCTIACPKVHIDR